MAQPAQNALIPSKWQCVISRLPNTVFYLTSVDIPGISIDDLEQPSPFGKIPVPGDRVLWEPLRFKFYQDTTLSGWEDIFNWLTGLGRPNDAGQYADLAANSVVGGVTTYGVRPPYSDLTINLYSSKNNIIASWYFTDAFPIALDAIPLTYSESADEVIDCGVTFKYTTYTFSRSS